MSEIKLNRHTWDARFFPKRTDIPEKSNEFQYVLVSRAYLQWNESSKATSGGTSHSLKIDFFEIPAMVGNFFSFRGLPTTKFFFLASKVGDENPLKWP